MTGFGLPHRSGLGAKRRRVAVRQFLFEQREVNHFVLENFEQRRFFRTAKHAADFKTGRIEVERFAQKHAGELDKPVFDVDIARRARESAAPANFAGREGVVKKMGVDLGVKRGEFALGNQRHARSLTEP